MTDPPTGARDRCMSRRPTSVGEPAARGGTSGPIIADAVSGVPGTELVFVPGDPPRAGSFAWYDPAGPAAAASPHTAQVEVVVPAGSRVRRRRVAAVPLSVVDAVVVLAELERGAGGAEASASALVWARALTAGLVLVARGRLYPTVSAAGFDAWAVGPLDTADRRLLDELAAAFPVAAHALWVPRSRPLAVASPDRLVRAMWDALADTLARSAAAPLVAGGDLFAAEAPQPADHLLTWLGEWSSGFEGGADVALRIELDGGLPPVGPDAGPKEVALLDAEPSPVTARAVVQVASRTDPSLVVDADRAFGAPAALAARFGDDVEADVLRALRRGARAWPPLGDLLARPVPDRLDLSDDDLSDLLGDAAADLGGAGISVLWPAGMFSDGVRLAGSIGAPGAVAGSGFTLDELVSFRWQATLGGEVLSEEEVALLAEAKRGVVRLRGRFVAVDPELVDRLRHKPPRPLTAVEALAAALSGSVDVDGELVEVTAQPQLAALADRLRDASSDAGGDVVVPSRLLAELRPYQQRGLAWLAEMTGTGLGGCLADDMGLGKTLQVIALHLHRAERELGPTLVVCPTSLLANWEREVRRFAPSVPVRRHHGPGRSLAGLVPDELVVTSYGVARYDAADLGAAGFTLVVADEAQHAKNPATATARALRAISAPARLALTGTPVENRLSDLWSILDFTTPGLLGPLERFLRTVATPIERYHDPDATARLARIVQPFVLRRRKSDPDVAPDLPARTISDLPVALTREQVELYEAVVREAMAVIEGSEGFERQGLVLKMLTALKQICNHPAQYLHQSGPLAGRSGKLAALEELVPVIASEGESVLVFSQFVECLGLVEARLAELGVGCLLLHGKVPARRRAAMVDEFQSGRVPVFLLSLKAGGVGLNLTRASHVVHFDRWWNPAVEDQATDRAHRIGQTRAVQVHRLIAEGTLEDRIAKLIEGKRELAESVVGGGEAWIGQLSDAELASLVQLGGGR